MSFDYTDGKIFLGDIWDRKWNKILFYILVQILTAIGATYNFHKVGGRGEMGVIADAKRSNNCSTV